MKAVNGKSRKRTSTKFDLPEMSEEDWKVPDLDGGPAASWHEVQCPYCDETFEVLVNPASDGLGDRKTCKVCTKPVTVSAEADGDEVVVSVDRA